MAKSERKIRNDPSRPTTKDDYTPEQWSHITSRRSELGANTRTNAVQTVEENRRRAYKTNSIAARKKYLHQANSVEAALPFLKDKPVTSVGAANRRLDLFEQHVASIRAGDSGLEGLSWYPDHRGEINGIAASHGFDSEQAAGVSAVLSPGKNPKVDELPALNGLLGLLHSHNDHHIHIPATVDHSTGELKDPGFTGKVNDPELKDRTLSRGLSRAAGERSMGRAGKPVDRSVESSHPDFEDAGLAHGLNTEKAIRMIRGGSSFSDEVNPNTSPKVWGYGAGISNSRQSAEELDYRGVAYHLAHSDPNQGMMMFSQQEAGQKMSDDSILSPKHATAEDTWMMAISSGQDEVASGPTGRTLSPAKRAVSDGGPASPYDMTKGDSPLRGHSDLTMVGANHAFDHNATVNAAARYGPVTFNQHGEDVALPSVMMQSGAWTQVRRNAGEDSEWNKRSRSDEFHRTPPPNPNQGKLL